MPLSKALSKALKASLRTALAGSITSSTLLYLLALKSTGSTSLITQSSPSASRSSIPLLVTSSASSPASYFSPKPYLTIHDLFIRYAPLSKLTNALITPSVKVSLPRVLPPMILKDLFDKFVPKASVTPLNPPTP